MSLATGSGKLHQALKDMRRSWEQVKADWGDQVRQDFEDQQWLPLEAQVLATLRQMDRLGQVLDQARRECSE